jgi:hypothetical protein
VTAHLQRRAAPTTPTAAMFLELETGESRITRRSLQQANRSSYSSDNAKYTDWAMGRIRGASLSIRDASLSTRSAWVVLVIVKRLEELAAAVLCLCGRQDPECHCELYSQLSVLLV